METLSDDISKRQLVQLGYSGITRLHFRAYPYQWELNSFGTAVI